MDFLYNWEIISPCCCVRKVHEPRHSDCCAQCEFTIIPWLCTCFDCRNGWFISPVYIYFQFETFERTPFDDADFEEWMKISYPKVNNKRIYVRKFQCCCFGIVETFEREIDGDDFIKYRSEYIEHLKHVPGSETYMKAQEDFTRIILQT